MGETWKTACPLNCFDVCGLLVTTENGKVTAIEGDPEHPITKGKICGRGKMLKDRMYHQNRLLHPLKKINGQFARISWDQALDEISLKMKEIKETYGPTAILHSYDYASSGLLKELDGRFFNYFGGMTKVIGSLCWGAGIQAQQYDFGNSLNHHVEDIQNAKTIVVWGRNITTTNMHLYRFIMDAKKQGTKLVVINPIKNGIAKQGDLFLPITPGMDGHLALTMSKIIIENGWYDQEFIRHYTVGFEAFKKELEKINIKDISKEINIDVKDIVQLAKWYAKDRPVMTFLGLGMQRYTNGGNTVRAIDALAALTGNIGIAGGGVNYANRLVGESFGWEELLREDLRMEYRTFFRPSQAEEIIKAKEPPIKMMFISRTNLLTQLPDVSRTIKALEQVETKVVLDLFLTDTAKMADYVLPVASVFEEEDIYYGSMFHSYIRYGPKLVDPPGEAWSELKIWSELAKRLELQGFERSREEFFEIALKPLHPFGIHLSVLKEKQQIELPLPKIPWGDKRFTTPSGKFEFYSEKAKNDGYSPTAKIMYPKESLTSSASVDPHPYQLLSIHPRKSIHSQHHWLNQQKELKPFVYIPKEIAEKERIEEHDQVMVYNERGKVIGKAKIVKGNHPKTIMIEEGYGLDTGGNVNYLTKNGLSEMGNSSIFYECFVSIKKMIEE
ncbi:molybdopterin-containing oxidoreductase family protein [Tepidibacillus sp. LV47]|uniref:molybdopterin-containing oxidoreductase family protein n=1 Tax=Tepidibacillus sp. LV47 TaxID=3398228 RepID=UPI003AAF43CE